MRVRSAGIFAVVSAVLGGGIASIQATAATATSVPSGPAVGAAAGWERVQLVPGAGELNRGAAATIASVSCSSPGNCALGGQYTAKGGPLEAFVDSERYGVWRRAEEVPGSAALNTVGVAGVTSVSCSSTGNCNAGGIYSDGYFQGYRYSQAFVVREHSGTWGRAREILFVRKARESRNASLNAMSCTSAENCAAGGGYMDSAGNAYVFVVSESRGAWGRAQRIEFASPFSAIGSAPGVNSVSCTSAGNCSAGGAYTGPGGNRRAFVLNERHGAWQKAREVPGEAVYNAFSPAEVTSVSCASAGNCAAGGYFTDDHYQQQAFVVTEHNGSWGEMREVAADINVGGLAQVNSVSCSKPGNCLAGGSYRDSSSATQAFVVTEKNGAWQPAQEVPGSAGLNTSGFAQVNAVSCASVGNCAAAGSFSFPGGTEAMVDTEQGGIWAPAREVPGFGALNRGGNGQVEAISCAEPGKCLAGGSYYSHHVNGVFVVSRT